MTSESSFPGHPSIIVPCFVELFDPSQTSTCVYANVQYHCQSFVKLRSFSNLNCVNTQTDSSGAELLSEPFQCCVLPNFIHDPTTTACEVSKVGGAGFLQQLKEALLRLKFYEKNNDLYQFHQVNDFCTHV